MNPIWAVIFVLTNWVPTPQPFQVQFARSAIGRNVTVCIDGQIVEQTFAGKLSFRDQARSWQSVCANVRAPISEGQIFSVRQLSSSKFGGNVSKAGNIVAKYFNTAQTPDQCAGLQIAVWKALEDGADQPDFQSGNFQVLASTVVLQYAQQYYQAINEPGQAAYLFTGGGPNEPTIGQSQISPVN